MDKQTDIRQWTEAARAALKDARQSKEARRKLDVPKLTEELTVLCKRHGIDYLEARQIWAASMALEN